MTSSSNPALEEKRAVPEGWVETTLGSIIDLKYGKSLPAKMRNGGGVPVYGSNGVVGSHTSALVESEGLIVGRKGSYGEVRFCDQPFFPIDTTYYVDEFYHQPIRYWFHQLKHLPLTTLNRSTAIPGLNREDAYEQRIVLPPLAEQKIIAAKLDELLTQVNALKTRLDTIPKILKRFRQSVLAAAVSGRLTEDWRSGVSRQAEFSTLGDVGIHVKTGPFGSALHKVDYIVGGVPVINPMHINEGKIAPSASMSTTRRKAAELSAWTLKEGDVIVGRRGEMGRAAVIDKSHGEMLCGTGSMILRGDGSVNPEYICFVIRSPVAVDYFNRGSVGTTMVNLNQEIIKDLKVYLPPLEEQTEIVRRVEQLFTYADQIEKQVESAQARVNHLTQSILAKAFRGELTAKWREQNPELIRDENSAEALLAEIKAERALVKKQPKPKRTAVKKKTGSSMSKQFIKVVEALKQAGEPLSGQQLLAAAGYPNDSSTEQLEAFFLDIRDALTRDHTIVKTKRTDDGQDWFALAETSKKHKDGS